ncbi:MAG TPA: hypothetical protein VF411_15280 [Bacteroidia bacterium]
MATIIPTSIAGFNRYINQTNALLIEGSPENYTRYNWTADNLTAWQEFQTEWFPIFDLYDNVASYTTSGKNGLLVIIENAINYANENRLILLLKATLNLTTLECTTFNIPISYAKVIVDTHHATASGNKTVATSEGVFAHLTPKAGGALRVQGFTETTHVGRARKKDGYDLLEYASAVFYSGTGNLPTSADDLRLTVAHSSRASFILQTAAMTANLPPIAQGAIAPAKVLVIFFRWAKSKHPDLDGPWSAVYTTVLL